MPAGIREVVDLLPSTGRAIDVACGDGSGSIWLAERGLSVVGIDVSDLAVQRAVEAAELAGVADRCRFTVHDLDHGLPPGPPVDLILCHKFSAAELDHDVISRLAPGGVLAITVLSEVDAGPGPFRARPGELLERFSARELRFHREAGGTATLVGVATGPAGPNAA